MNPGEVVLRDKIELTTRGFSVDCVSDSLFKSISYKHEISAKKCAIELKHVRQKRVYISFVSNYPHLQYQ